MVCDLTHRLWSLHSGACCSLPTCYRVESGVVMEPSNNELVSIVIPTKNSAAFLKNCLKSIADQTYPNVEVVVVDSGSTDDTEKVAACYGTRYYTFSPVLPSGTFDAPHKRNYGAKQAVGDYIYIVDSDMELMPNVVKDAVELCNKGYDAVVIPEDSFGIGIWARAKNLERRCYWGDSTVEAPRFVKKHIWDRLGGLDETVGGNDDWDFYQKLLDNGSRVGRTRSIVRHNEGHLKLSKLFRKRFMYGRDAAKYIAKRPRAATTSYFPVRKSYLNHWRLFLARPVDTGAFIVMRTAEYLGGLSGIVYSVTMSNRA